MVRSHIQAPKPQDVEDALRALSASRLQQEPIYRVTEQTNRNDSLDFGRDLAPSIVPRDPAIDQDEKISSDESASNKPSRIKRVVGALIGSIFIAIMATFAWQAYTDDQTQNMIKALWSSVHSKKLKPSSGLAVNVSPQSPDQTMAVSPPAPPPVVLEASPELMRQVQNISSGLAALRHSVEEIASKQDQTTHDVASITHDIASIQAAEQNLSKQISSLARANVARAAAHKNVPGLPPAQAPKQSTAVAPAPPPDRSPPPVPAASTAN
jgi:hypothetical protein